MSGRGGNNRKNKHRFSGKKDEPHKSVKKPGDSFIPEPKFEKSRDNSRERPQWTEPVQPVNPITTPDCPWCGKPIKDITTALSDKMTGKPVHFDCVISKIAEMEQVDSKDSVCYIGGGRFGIIHYNNPPDMRDFTIKKTIEWEIKEKDNEWRKPLSEYYSLT